MKQVNFFLQTDASAVNEAVLEQDSHVRTYASRSLTTTGQQYSAIQRECLSIVYARHTLWARIIA